MFIYGKVGILGVDANMRQMVTFFEYFLPEVTERLWQVNGIEMLAEGEGVVTHSLYSFG